MNSSTRKVDSETNSSAKVELKLMGGRQLHPAWHQRAESRDVFRAKRIQTLVKI